MSSFFAPDFAVYPRMHVRRGSTKFHARVAVEEGLFWLHCGNGCSFYVFETREQIERCSYFFIVS